MANEKKKVPAEAVELYTRFIHGEITRRAFISGVSRYATAGLSTAAIIGSLMPDYARAQQIRNDDERIRASYQTVDSPEGNGAIRGYLVRPDSADSRSENPVKLPGVLVIHENRGLNPHTEDVARRFALENFMAFAPDTVSSLGGYPGDDFRGGQLFSKINAQKMLQDLVAAARWLKAHPGCNGKIAVTGFCYGGGASNALAGVLGDELAAAAPFYGGATPPDTLPNVKAAILIHHGALDARLAAGYPAQEADLKRHNIRYEGHVWPDSVHGFFNDATPERYNKVTAPQAWSRTIEWFNQYARAA
jgi:carboxymethylenebutenolidase